jgi:hypothetical protein
LGSFELAGGDQAFSSPVGFAEKWFVPFLPVHALERSRDEEAAGILRTHEGFGACQAASVVRRALGGWLFTSWRQLLVLSGGAQRVKRMNRLSSFWLD